MKILYIGGATRSGSTLTEMILGNNPGFFSVGEVRYFWEHVQQGDIRCGCGQLLSECKFWSQIINSLQNEGVNFGQMSNLAMKLDRTRNLPWLSTSLDHFQKREIDQFVSNLDILYTKINSLVGEKVIIDSSKLPSHLYLLRKIPQIDLHILHLIRDGRAVAYSWNKRRKKDLAITTNTSWMPKRSMIWATSAWAVENYFVSTFKDRFAYAQMRYEDFTTNPSQELNRIQNELGLPNIKIQYATNHSIKLTPNHSVNGNPIRFENKPITIAPDNEWQKIMPKLTRKLLGSLFSPILLKFQYKI